MARGQCVGREMQSAGQRKRIGQQFQRVAQVDDISLLAGIELALQFLRFQTRGYKFLDDHAAADDAAHKET